MVKRPFVEVVAIWGFALFGWPWTIYVVARLCDWMGLP